MGEVVAGIVFVFLVVVLVNAVRVDRSQRNDASRPAAAPASRAEGLSTEQVARLMGPATPPTHPDAIPIDRMWADGFAADKRAWRPVEWLPRDAIRIDSGDRVHAPLPGNWHVWGPAEGTSVALFRITDKGQAAADGGTTTLRDLLAANARYLVGQTITHEDSEWRVTSAEAASVHLEDGTGRSQDVSSTLVVDANLDRLRSQVVLLVDVG